jgi:uncharacterized membrane protein (DUF485 family)
MGYKSDIDDLINRWTGHHLTRRQHKRGRFRRQHHYFNYLKYWDLYQQKFAYLDAKSQGLLAMSAILSAVFAILIGGGVGFKNPALSHFVTWGAIFGILLLISAQVLLLRCFSTTASVPFPTFDEEAIDLEARICSGGGESYFGRTRTLEGNMDSFLNLHLKMIQETGKKQNITRLKLRRRWAEVRANDEDSFDVFEEDVSSFLGRLRDAIEEEVSKRHDNYHMARNLILISLFILFACVVSYSIDQLIIIHHGYS